jgi:5,10-methylenetetrahydromethanopterin reductase
LNGGSPADLPGVSAGWQAAARLEAGAAPTRIYLGGMGPRMLELAGREADGVLALCLPPSHYHWVTAHIAAGAQKSGRSTDQLDVACCVWVAIDGDRDRAETMLAEKIALYSGALSRDALAEAGFDPDEFSRLQELVTAGDVRGATRAVTRQMLALGIAGDVSAVIDRCQELIDQGVRHLSFGHPHGADRVEAIKVLGTQVLPALRSYANGRAEQQPSEGK